MPDHAARRARTQRALKKLGAEALISTHAIQTALHSILSDRDKPTNADRIYKMIRDFKEPAIEGAVMAATAQPGAIPGVKSLDVAVPKLYYAVLRLGLYVWKVVSRSAATYRALLMLPEEERSRTGRDFQQSSTVTAVAAEALAKSIGLPEPSSDVFFQIGLLHDLGLLALWAVNTEVSGNRNEQKRHTKKMRAYLAGELRSEDYLKYEEHVFGMNHCEAAAQIFQGLRFIQHFSLCMSEHHGHAAPRTAAAEVLVFRIAHGLSCLAKYATEGLFAPQAVAPVYVGELRRDITADVAKLLKLKTITVTTPIDTWIDDIASSVEQDGGCRELLGAGLHDRLTDFRNASKRLLAPLGLQQLMENATPGGTEDPAPAFVRKHISLFAGVVKEPGTIFTGNVPLAPDGKLVPVHAAYLTRDMALTLFALGPSKGAIFSCRGTLEPSLKFMVDSLEHSLKSVRFCGLLLKRKRVQPARLKGCFVVGSRFSGEEAKSLKILQEFAPKIEFISYADLACTGSA